MPSQENHLAAARSNEALAVAMIQAHQAYAWAIVLAFYSALHWVDAFLANASIHPENHSQRNLFVARTQLRTVLEAYQLLRDFSQDARYELVPFSESEAHSLIAGELTDIKTHVQRLLAI